MYIYIYGIIFFKYNKNKVLEIRKIMKILIKKVVVLVALSCTILYAGDTDSHSSHNHDSHEHGYNTGLKSKSIQKIAKDEVKRLVLEKKIAKSWKSMPITKIGRTHDSYIDDWVVVFENPKIKKKSRRTLYIFISKIGNVKGVNYTGK